MLDRPQSSSADLSTDIAGMDSLDFPVRAAEPRRSRAWRAAWPKLTAVGLFLGLWQLVVWTHWKPDYVLPGPGPALISMWHGISSGRLIDATLVTLQRAVFGFAIAMVIGLVAGAVVARNKVLRAAFGSMITGLQTMPTIAWFPLAILLFGLSETAITFVVILGAAPSVANGVIAGADHIPRTLVRAGRMLGARGIAAYRHVLLPGAVPGMVAGLKQGWAFAWRSLMAGELLVIVAHKRSLGVELQYAREVSDMPGLLGTMIVILMVGLAIDALVFGRIDKVVRARRGLLG